MNSNSNEAEQESEIPVPTDSYDDARESYYPDLPSGELIREVDDGG